MKTFDTQKAIDRIMGDPGHFASMGGIQLRSYQLEVALQVYDSVKYARGLSFVVMFPRQSGKNELQAQLEAYFLLRYSRLGGEMVKISPTWKPQSQNALRRLERVLAKQPAPVRRMDQGTGLYFPGGGCPADISLRCAGSEYCRLSLIHI